MPGCGTLQRSRCIGQRQVELAQRHLDAMQRPDLFGQLFELVDAARHQDHVETLGSDLQGELGTGAFGRAAHECPRTVAFKKIGIGRKLG